MKKILYLNWDKEEMEQDANIMKRFMFGFDEGESLHLEWYRERKYPLQSESLNEVWHDLNKDDRINGQEERSLCVGDIIEFDGHLWGVNPIGFIDLGERV